MLHFYNLEGYFGCYLLKIKTNVKKLVFYYYADIYKRFLGWLGVVGPEAAMPLKFRPKFSKIVELMLYLAHKRPDADKYQAVKFFYLADREHFARYGRPITYEQYFAMEFGPVASTVLDILNGNLGAIHRAGIENLPFETEAGRTSDGKYATTFIRKPLREIDADVFSKSDLRVFDEIIERYRDATFDELFKATHEHYAWKNAWHSRKQGERAEMFYEEMIEDEKRRAEVFEDVSPVAAHMK